MLFRRDGAVVANVWGIWAEVGDGKLAEFAGRFAGVVEDRAAAAELVAAVDSAFDKFAVCTDLYLEDLGQSGFGSEAEPAVSAEISQRIFDQVPLVNLHSAHNVRAVAEHEVGTGVDNCMGKGRQIPAVFAEKNLGLIADVLMVGALAAAMK